MCHFSLGAVRFVLWRMKCPLSTTLTIIWSLLLRLLCEYWFLKCPLHDLVPFNGTTMRLDSRKKRVSNSKQLGPIIQLRWILWTFHTIWNRRITFNARCTNRTRRKLTNNNSKKKTRWENIIGKLIWLNTAENGQTICKNYSARKIHRNGSIKWPWTGQLAPIRQHFFFARPYICHWNCALFCSY